jgi:hypothetical protein
MYQISSPPEHLLDMAGLSLERGSSAQVHRALGLLPLQHPAAWREVSRWGGGQGQCERQTGKSSQIPPPLLPPTLLLPQTHPLGTDKDICPTSMQTQSAQKWVICFRGHPPQDTWKAAGGSGKEEKVNQTQRFPESC